jgi:hypothetical protein
VVVLQRLDHSFPADREYLILPLALGYSASASQASLWPLKLVFPLKAAQGSGSGSCL